MNRNAFECRLRLAAPFFPLNPAQVEALWLHYDLLRRWNARINLTRVIELEDAVRFHYGESLFAANQAPPGVASVIDVGSGAGFPGFVLAVAKPEWQVTLLESDQRKAAFLREASDLAPNVRVVGRRSEEVMGSWDLAVSRAVKAEEVIAFAERTAKWLIWIGTEPPEQMEESSWTSTELSDGRGRLWLRRIRA